MGMMNKDGSPNVGAMIKLGVLVVAFIIIVPLFFHTISWIKVEGNEALVEQRLDRGVMPDVKLSGTHLYCGWLSDMYKYNIGTQKCTFDSDKTNQDSEYESIEVNCGENGGQRALIALSINYRVGWDDDGKGNPVFNPARLVSLHKDGIGKTYEQVVVKRTIVDVVNKIARPHQALEIYSGAGYVTFKEDIDKALKGHEVFMDRGIFVENTILYSVHLDKEYENEIKQKVIAQQQTLRKMEETKASQEEAKRVFAESQATVEKVRQEAEANKITQVKKAEANKEMAVLAAEAEKSKRVLEAEGNRDANLANASGVLALGEAEAKVMQLKRDADYAGEAGARRASVQIAGMQADKLKGMLSGVSVISDKALYNMGKATGMYTVNVDEK